MKKILFAICLVWVAGCTESTAEKGSDENSASQAVEKTNASDRSSADLNEQKINSEMRKYDIGFEEHSRYFSLYTFGKTRNFIHFKNVDVVYEVKFESPGSASVTANIFAAVERDVIPLWINNQHSDGLYGEAPTPKVVELSSYDIRILESQKVGEQEGDNGDEYDVFGIKYYLASQKLEDKIILPEVIYTTKVYVRTKDITCAPTCEQ